MAEGDVILYSIVISNIASQGNIAHLHHYLSNLLSDNCQRCVTVSTGLYITSYIIDGYRTDLTTVESSSVLLQETIIITFVRVSENMKLNLAYNKKGYIVF